VAGEGLLVSAFLVFVARPASVLACLTPFRYPVRDQLMVSWGGLRGAVPIVLATNPLIAGVSGARPIFNIVFFVVFVSVLLQGATIPIVSRWLKVTAPVSPQLRYPIEYQPIPNVNSELAEIAVPARSPAVGRCVFEVGLPPGALIVLIRRRGQIIVPAGNTEIRADDRLLVLAERSALRTIRASLDAPASQERAAEDHEADREIDHQSGHVDKRRDERRR
jgi:cell volume regulation protein A